MAEALILELEGFARAQYVAVNDLPAIDMGSGELTGRRGCWVLALARHFRRVGSAQRPASRAEWREVAAHHSPGGGSPRRSRFPVCRSHAGECCVVP
jgi:hypothetical protein